MIARIEGLRADMELSAGDLETLDATLAAHAQWRADNPDEAEELTALEALADEAEGCCDWQHGETLVRDSYFQEYAQELAESCGMVPDNLTWPCNCIDWEHAARELRYDYTSVEFNGVTYWVRS